MTEAELAKAETEHFRASIQPPDFGELAHEQFIATPEKYEIPARLSVQKILVTSTVRGDEEAKTRAEEARQKALADPAAFDALVEGYSDAATKQRDRGLIRYPERVADPALAAAIQALAKEGDISPVVKTSDGYAVLKLVEKQAARPQKFEDVRERIVEGLKAKYVADALKAHAAEFSNKPVDANTALMDTLRTRYGQVAATPAVAGKPAKT
jgi:parvulin-like peptidyl-prolyl isomerase